MSNLNKAVILVSYSIQFNSSESCEVACCNVFELTTLAAIQVGGPSRGTRFRPLSLDLPKVIFLLLDSL
jgi:hypothetical protein